MWQSSRGSSDSSRSAEPKVSQRKAARLCQSSSSSSFWPNHSLIFFRDWRQALVNESLHALPAIGFGRKNVSLGISCNAVHAVEFARLSTAFPKAGEHGQ